MRFERYEVGEFFDEMFGEQGSPRALARALVQNIEGLPAGELLNRQRAAERALLQMGITFNVYGERAGVEKIFPFDLVPRIVLGEEPAGGASVRYVDSSLERLQIKAQGLSGDRFAITVNGYRIPLHPTGNNAEGVAGVRYRAWQPPECLQPTIGVHTPLVFDLYDTWNHRSLGGCRYHVAHPRRA